MEHILVVDDDAQVRKVMNIFLNRHSFLVEEAENGRQALVHIEDNRPALVFLDVVLPDLDGIQVLKKVKQLYPDVPVIIMTGLREEEIWKKAMSSGATDYITKPFSYADLYTNLKVHLNLDAES